ncbi:MAG: site-2 protease family protein, partial [archaeon]|nr:site-2 protease family protein [archaeon]
MSIMFWDLMLLAIFVVVISIFLYLERKKIKKEGLLLLYHTSWGIKLINSFGKKHQKSLKILSYVSVFVGYLLMIAMIYFFVKILWVYFFQADVVRAIKVPPITPLIPYLPQIFQLNFLPPFYFSYWIIVLAIVAITHEFFHGIFAKIANVRTKTTGFGFFPFFLPVFLAAFVNLDEKAMAKKKNFEQMAVLSAGTFANILTAVLGVILMAAFFSLSFSPAGVVYDDYAYGLIPIGAINSVNGIPVENLSYELLNNLTYSGNINLIIAGNTAFLGIKGVVPESDLVALYYDAPALRENLSGAITKIDGERLESLDELSLVLSSYSPGDEVTITVYNGTEEYEKEIILGKSPEGKAWLGVSFINPQSSGIMGTVTSFIVSYKTPHIYYFPNFPAAQYIYDLLWWLVLISFSVALVNMLPVGIFDGGRFFYLTVLAITKS